MEEQKTTYFSQERRGEILRIVAEKKKVTVTQLCKYFKVSSATIRNDLRDLQLNGLLVRTHGGAIAKTQTGFELDSKDKETRNHSQKQRIALQALELIEDGDKIILDTGTTTLELAKVLHQRKDITVVTNDIVIARILEDIATVQIILMGGVIRKKFHCSVGIQESNWHATLQVDKGFMGVNSFSLVSGATTPDIYQAQTKTNMINMSNKVILLCDSSKIGKASFVQFATVDQIDTLVTEELSPDTKSHFEESGLEVITCGE